MRDLGDGTGHYPGSSDEYRRKEGEDLEHFVGQDLDLPEELVQYGVFPDNLQVDGKFNASMYLLYYLKHSLSY